MWEIGVDDGERINWGQEQSLIVTEMDLRDRVSFNQLNKY